MPVTIEKRMDDRIVESVHIEYKEGWNPDAVARTIWAFANDLDNWSDGFIVLVAKEKDGMPVHPAKGLKGQEIDPIRKELLLCCRRRSGIETLILDQLADQALPENQLYYPQEYSGTRSKIFKSCVNELLVKKRPASLQAER